MYKYFDYDLNQASFECANDEQHFSDLTKDIIS